MSVTYPAKSAGSQSTLFTSLAKSGRSENGQTLPFRLAPVAPLPAFETLRKSDVR
jgi:hypothetical protein